jgi:hypothetical protein
MRRWKVSKVISVEVDAKTSLQASSKANKVCKWVEEQLHVEEVEHEEDRPIKDPKDFIM